MWHTYISNYLQAHDSIGETGAPAAPSEPCLQSDRARRKGDVLTGVVLVAAAAVLASTQAVVNSFPTPPK